MRRNVEYAQGKAEEEGLALRALCGNALDVGKMFPSEAFDVVLLMGPLYHL
ncbi:MAG TPA: class I SAM-dependent methyltransferase [Firmicutes bacterium]|nr:class I SAM-dependent methyltransferase [Bacillota bacterium]